MIKIFLSDKDTYITNKVISGEQKVSSSLGHAGSLDLFKIYGNNQEVELTKILIHFDIEELKELYKNNQIDIEDSSFNCQLFLKDVYGGQTTPKEFNLSLFPLSRSFVEGTGSDVVYLTDHDVSNYISSSNDQSWFIPGAGFGSSIGNDCDFFSSDQNSASLERKQFFKSGEEDVLIDVTSHISGVLTGQIPDSGFKISFSNAEELDYKTYFVKRFASRHAYDQTLQPKLFLRFNDSIKNDVTRLKINSTGSINLYNFDENNALSNLVLDNVELVGDNCLKLRLLNSKLPNLNLAFTGSQYSNGSVKKIGIYRSEVSISETNEIKTYVQKSGSLDLIPVWSDFNETRVFHTGEAINFFPKKEIKTAVPLFDFTINVKNIPDVFSRNENVIARVNVFDYSFTEVMLQKVPVETPNLVLPNSHFRIIDANTGVAVFDFDKTYNSTLISSDAKGMFFEISKNSLMSGRSYKVEILVQIGGSSKIYRDVSNIFKVIN